MSIYWKDKVLLFKAEATYGVDPNPSGAADAVRAKNVTFRPMEGTDVDLGHETPYLGANETLPAELHATLSFECDLVGSGVAGTPPPYASALKACATAETVDPGVSVTFNPVSDNHDSATAYLNIGGILYRSNGMRGNCEIVVNASGVPVLMFSFTGLFVAPSDQAKPTPDYSAWLDPKVASNANTPVFEMGGNGRVLRSFKLNFGNEVQGRFLIGKEEIASPDRNDMIECQVEATPLAIFDPYALALNGTDLTIALQHGTVPGRIVSLNVPRGRMQRPGAPTQSQGVMEHPLSIKALPVNGNDQWTLTFT
ncbi:MAG: phage tail tube protein [Pelagimonas sp.]|jgi:hypothetical protein|nr:phage tail tube protein [Pelagimonas sp.]